jgi:hypothetical protein
MSYWRDNADAVLAPLFADGKRPTDQELFESYPFGERNYTPYKIWLEQVKWFKAGCPRKGAKIDAALPGQEALL